MHSQHFRIVDEIDQEVYYINMHHNGDYSGNVIVNIRTVPVDEAPRVDSDQMSLTEADQCYPRQEVHLPMKALQGFLAEYVRSKRIGELEQATTDELLS